MLQSIRDHTHGWIAGVIISILILSFALWGIHSYTESSANNTVAATVDGTEISKNQLKLAYERLHRQLQMQSNSIPQLTDKAERELKNRALEGLVTIQALTEASLHQKYRISSIQINNFLRSMPEFQVNSHFSADRFQKLIEASLYSVNDFYELVRNSLLIDQPRLGIIFTSFALPNEVSDTMTLVNQERDIDYLFIPFSQTLTKINIPKEKVVLYYNQHQNEFKTEEQVSVDYVELSLKNLMAGFNPSIEELKKYYSENSASYQQPFEKIKNQLKESYIRQHAEEKFAEVREQLANETYENPKSLDLAAKKLGLQIKSSALFTKIKGNDALSQNNKVREVAFSQDVLEFKNNSDVIPLNNDTVVVIHLKDYQPAKALPLNVVEKQIIQKLQQQDSELRATQLANEILKKLKENAPEFENILKDNHLSWKKTGFIGRHADKISSAILETAFAMSKPQNNHLSFAISKTPDGYAVIALKGVREGKEILDPKQYQVFAEQIQNTQGLMEYELYKQSVLRNAKIVIEN